VETGLTPGQVIVAGGAAFLQDGDAVTPVRAPAPAASTKQSSLRGRSGG
jgi:hypothetical protein